jgi:GNAT superfamily N-acetyltransferase
LCALARHCPQGGSLQFYHLRQDHWERCRSFPRFQVWVAEQAGQIVGAASLAFKKVWIAGQLQPVVYLFDRMVHPRFRRQGIGRALLQQELAQTSGAMLHYGLVLEDNQANRGLLEGAGFCRLPHPLVYLALLPQRRRTAGPPIRVAEPIARDHARLLDRYLRPRYGMMDQTAQCGMASLLLGEPEPAAGGILYRHGWKVVTRAPWYLRWASRWFGLLPRLGQPVRSWVLGHVWYRDRSALASFLGQVGHLAADAGAHVVLMPVAGNDPRLPDFCRLTLHAWGVPAARLLVYVRGPLAQTLVHTPLPLLPSPRDG